MASNTHHNSTVSLISLDPVVEIEGWGSSRNAAPAEAEVAAQVTSPVIGAFKVQAPAFNKPCHFELDACINQAIEASAGVFQGQRIGIDEVFGYGEVQLGRKRHEISPWTVGIGVLVATMVKINQGS
ncbi:hypothetical protein S7711_10964 [Stachybotrys chartarum IBT 7711]|uniref:Uncharacterized protein n=1 Tax=Stachybotrys chartarum (strain CBS 109288 / IBT 7711) TaxID=1280523 RepID=A0A084AS27_STACB|nr:hypothetical protein S7711_10964 [Stachybotrys chartarum IBT 7711]KFA53475.1 hypothetical protein S40293_10701 [Stachybotrys chartarum IBT 40293]